MTSPHFSPLVSILVPCYNVENYLYKCLSSIKSQTLSDIEVICINDGSTDSTLEIIQEFIKKDQRFRLLNKKNSGYGDSLNKGMSIARGEYIGIVESDDFIEPTMFEKLYKAAKSYNLDLCRCSYFYHRDGKDTIQTWPSVPKNKVIKPLNFLQVFLQAPSVWVNLYSKHWIVQQNLQFLPTPGASYQDISFCFKAYYCSDRFMMLDDALLHYRLDNENSSIHNQEKVFYVCNEWEEIYKFLKKQNATRDFFYLLPIIQHTNYLWNLGRISKNYKYSFLKQWQTEIKEHLSSGETNWLKLPFTNLLVELVVYFCPSFLLKYEKEHWLIRKLKPFFRH